VLPFRRAIDATRRTVEGPPSLPGPPAAFSVEPAEVAASAPRGKRRWQSALLVILAIMVLIGQAWVRSEAKEIQHELVASPSPDLDAVWERYQDAARLSFGLGLGLGAVRDELRSALVQQGERILDSYHGDSPRTTEKGWERAHHVLEEALDLDYDRGVRARMIYTQAHLDRIASQTLRAKGQKAEADKKVEDAVAGFRDAARRAPDWPDPYLGLARVYSYETFDLDALQKALGELGKRGYPLGRREKAMLADGFRRKGIEIQTRAEKTGRADDQLELLDRARDQFNQALSFYAEIPGYASARANSADVEERLHEVESRLDHLHEPGVLEKLLGF
jgi:tetratricopeptide (TPR) repeat protein